MLLLHSTAQLGGAAASHVAPVALCSTQHTLTRWMPGMGASLPGWRVLSDGSCQEGQCCCQLSECACLSER